MTKASHHPSQLTLSLFDTTAISGLTLDGGTVGVPATTRADRVPEPDRPDEAATPAAPAAPSRVPARTFRLEADRPLAQGWKARAADNFAAIRLSREIEADGRHATPEEQARLALFTGFGASELANALFPRAGEAFRPGWEEIGHELERLVPAEDRRALARSTQYAHYTPEFVVRAIWRALTRMGFAGGRELCGKLGDGCVRKAAYRGGWKPASPRTARRC
jgi:hypothetical protein